MFFSSFTPNTFDQSYESSWEVKVPS